MASTAPSPPLSSLLRAGVLLSLAAAAAAAQTEFPFAAGTDSTGRARAVSDAAGRVLIESPEFLNWLELARNQIVDVSPLGSLTSLDKLTSLDGLYLSQNAIVDVSLLAALTKLDELVLWGNPLSDEAITEQIPALRARGVEVHH